MNDAQYRKHNDRQQNSSTYHKKDGTNVRAILKEESRREIMEHISSTKKPDGDRVWKAAPVEVVAVCWESLHNEQLVFIPGNLVDGKPTKLYGPHRVHDCDKHFLRNKSGKVFYENSDKVFLQIS